MFKLNEQLSFLTSLKLHYFETQMNLILKDSTLKFLFSLNHYQAHLSAFLKKKERTLEDSETSNLNLKGLSFTPKHTQENKALHLISDYQQLEKLKIHIMKYLLSIVWSTNLLKYYLLLRTFQSFKKHLPRLIRIIFSLRTFKTSSKHPLQHHSNI